MIFDPNDPTPNMARPGGPPLKAAWPHGGRKPATAREIAKSRGNTPRGFHPMPQHMRPERPTPDFIRRSAMPTLYGSGQNGYVAFGHTLNKPPKGSDGCTVKTLDYRTPMSPERKRKV